MNIEMMMRLLKLATAATTLYRTAKHVTDEDFGQRGFPEWFRDELRDEHHVGGGWYECPRCGQNVRRHQLHVDHIIPHSRGGKTSRRNAQVLCVTCNCSKGANHSVFESMRGMGHGIDKTLLASLLLGYVVWRRQRSSRMAEPVIVRCGRCMQRNRLRPHRSDQRPCCGRCRQPLLRG